MPQEYNSPNPTGIGVGVFNQTNTTPLEIMMSNLKAEDEGEKAKQRATAAKLGQTKALLGDLKLDAKGIVDTDADDIRNQTQELLKIQAQNEMMGLDLNTPAGRAAQTQLEYKKKEIEGNIEKSRRWKEAFDMAAKAQYAHPDKWDLDAGNKKIADARSKSLKDRGDIQDMYGLLSEHKADFGKVMDTFMKGLKPNEQSTVVAGPMGGIVTETTSKYDTPALAKAALQYDFDAVKRKFESEDGFTQDAYKKRAGQAGNPYQLYVQDYLDNRLHESKKMGSTQFTPYERESAKMWGDSQKETEDATYLVDRLVPVLQGDDKVFGDVKSQDRGNIEPPNVEQSIAGGLVPDKTGKIKYSGVLAGTRLGKAIVPIPYKDGIKYQDIPENKVMYFANKDGKTYVKTTQSHIMQEQGIGDGLLPVDENFLDDLTATAPNPLRAKEALKKALIKKGMWDNGVIRVGAAPVTQTTTVKPTAGKIKIGGKEYSVKTVGQESLPLINTQDEYNSLPKNTKYIDSKGNTGVKK